MWWHSTGSEFGEGLIRFALLYQKASREDTSRGAEIWTRDLTDPNHIQKFRTVVLMDLWYFIAVRSHFSGSREDYDEL